MILEKARRWAKRNARRKGSLTDRPRRRPRSRPRFGCFPMLRGMGEVEESCNTLKALVLRRNTTGFSRVPNRAVAPKPTREANGCILRHLRFRKHYMWGSSNAADPNR